MLYTRRPEALGQSQCSVKLGDREIKVTRVGWQADCRANMRARNSEYQGPGAGTALGGLRTAFHRSPDSQKRRRC